MSENFDHDKEITASELKRLVDLGEANIIDVREVDEWDIVNIGGKHLPLSSNPVFQDEINKDKTTVIICHHGTRSIMVTEYMHNIGYNHVKSLHGGLDEYSIKADNNVKRY